MFIGTCTGMVSATSRPPSSCARSPAESWRGTRSGSRASTVSTFQLSGRLAAALTDPSSSISSSENWSRQPCTMPSSVVPAWAPVSALMAMSSSGVAHRLATGWPSPSLCDDDCVNEKPSAPASSDRPSSARISAICSGVASLPIASVPIT